MREVTLTQRAVKIVQSNIDYFAEKWILAVEKSEEEKRIGEKEVRGVIYQILNSLALVLDERGKLYLFEPHGVIYKKAKYLGELRRAQGYQLEEVLHEYLVLRKEIWQLFREKLRYQELDVFELEERINLCLMNILKATTESFHHRQTRDLMEQAITDPLTGLFNRRQFDKIIQQEIYRSVRYERPLTLLMLDIDHFKLFNDDYGHPAGDIALEQIAGIIRQFLRVSDAAARYGGEEFALILPETTEEQGYRVASRIRRGVERSQFFIGQETPKVQLTVSIGLACFPIDCKNGKELVKAADIALYKAKGSGRNRVICYSQDMGTLTRWFGSLRGS